ncbi:hypothetical protein, variant [Spizellomyces punctatus DAOM BR117]|uniref:Mitochondrial import inner membrane translocase subunit Tim21 n=1 Tax=Spizellomyces punctatus (strain DAOM BR117) TaxID=645134 RepID=A0A0L0HLS4_SPIPD|nr:hypothetical protein, variant [Spizellomyces punctatus DAOM BR117]KND02381.1 hypothetical protein, variant [Spizellomyces punctatus DAOM BR117]|eukprot:XP_016610420.1 hypothetical protein, variant [Spizellomyces punctatus DAOM BR117]
MSYIILTTIRSPNYTANSAVAHALQTLGYTGVIIVGLGVIGTAIYSIGLELVDQTDAWKVYDDALERVMNSEEVQKLVGIPMTGLADEGGRRGKSLSHHIVEDPTSGKTLLMKFYIKGAKSSGTVHVEMVQNKETSRWDYQLLLVDIAQHGGSKRVIVTDNRPIFTMSDPERRGWFGFGSARGIRRV